MSHNTLRKLRSCHNGNNSNKLWNLGRENLRKKKLLNQWKKKTFDFYLSPNSVQQCTVHTVKYSVFGEFSILYCFILAGRRKYVHRQNMKLQRLNTTASYTSQREKNPVYYTIPVYYDTKCVVHTACCQFKLFPIAEMWEHSNKANSTPV